MPLPPFLLGRRTTPRQEAPRREHHGIRIELSKHPVPPQAVAGQVIDCFESPFQASSGHLQHNGDEPG
jgi:hypothetical protein